MRVPHKALVLVADGRKMQLLRNDGTPDEPALMVERSEEHPNPSDRDHKSDAAGRAIAMQSGAGGRSAPTRASAMEETDFHQQEEDLFAAHAAEMLDRVSAVDSDAALIVIAPPRTLGVLRRHYGRKVAARLMAEVDKDLTRLEPHELAEALLRLPD